MKIKCNGCETAEAEVICCADEAVLCLACDDKIHKANKLASKHQRIHLFNSTMPKCDICQVDDRKHGNSEWSPILQATYEDLDIDDCLNKVPEIPLISSEDPSTSTGSALFWQKNFTSSSFGVFVPGLCHSKNGSLPKDNLFQPNAISSKRRRL